MAVPTRVPLRPAQPSARSGPDARGRVTGSSALLLALAVACGYAAFAGGATGPPRDARLEVGVALVALVAVAGWAQGGAIRWRADRLATAGLALLGLLAAWDAVSLLWSLTPDGAWQEANRVLAYALVVGLAMAAGASDPRGLERVATLVLASCTLVALYAFGTKVLPGLHVPLLLDLDQTGRDGRAQAPLGDWDALALIAALGVPLAVWLACDPSRRARDRGAAAASALLLACVLGLTYSRGGILAAVAALVVLTALGPARLRGLAVAAGVAAASVPVLAVAYTRDGISEPTAALSQRSSDGLVLLGVFLLSLAVLLGAMLAFGRLGPRVRWSAGRSRALFRAAGLVVVLAVIGLAIGLAASQRGLSGSVSDQAHTFASTPQGAPLDPGHLVSGTSGNRWTWWKEAAGAWSDRPVAGWGAGAFPALHLRYRKDELLTTHAFSTPLELGADTGVVGVALAAGAVLLLLAAALARRRTLPGGREREAVAAALAAVAAWLVHGLFAPDWSIPGVTLPALVLLGVAAGAGRRAHVVREEGAGAAGVVAAAGLAFCLVVVSAVLPSWADSKAAGAESGLARTPTEPQLRDAAAQADVAARLDPLALRPLLASADIARRRGHLLEARGYLLRAVRRQPDSALAWSELAGSAFELADRVGFERAALRALALDPLGTRTRQLAAAAVAARTPPGASGTAGGTPLTPAPVLAPVAPPVGATGATGAAGATGATGATGTTGPG